MAACVNMHVDKTSVPRPVCHQLHRVYIALHALSRCNMCLQVNRALRAFDRLETLADLATVDEDAPEFKQEIFDRIFVAKQVDIILQIACTLGKQSFCLKSDLLLSLAVEK